MIRFVTVSICVLAIIGCLWGQETPTLPETLSKTDIARIENGLVPRVIFEDEVGKTYALHDRMKEFAVPGISVALFDDHHIVWAQGYGMADETRHQAVDLHTRFQAASISKPVTAFAVLTLVQAKGLDLDGDVNAYLHGWKVPQNEFTRVEKVTIRRLLSHTAGLNVSGFAGYEKSQVIPDATGVLEGKGNSPALRVEAVPGTHYSYSGGGYVVLQKLIEDQSGQSFGEYVQRNVLTPLGMTDSTFDPYPSGHVSLAYDFNGRPLPGGWHVYPELAPAGLWTTPSDIAKFCFGVVRALTGSKDALISKSLAQQMVTPSESPDGGSGYGLGFELHGKGVNASFGHGGSNAGFKSELYYFPERKIGVVLMTNSESGRVVRNELGRSISNRFGLGLFPTSVIKQFIVESGELKALIGRYEDPQEKGTVYSAEVGDNGELLLKNLSTGKVNHLAAKARDTFIDRNTGEEISVIRKPEKSGIRGLLYNHEDELLKIE